MAKIPCFVLIYYDFNIIKTCIDSLLPHTGRLDLIVIENKSEFTESHIRPYIMDLVNKGKVLKYFLFSKNIANNAGEIVLDSGHIDFGDSDYVILTDGDLLVENQEWLSEQLHIMENDPDVLICATTLDTGNLPVEVIPSAAAWAPGGIEHEMYFEDTTGVHLLLMKTDELLKFLDYRKRNNLKFLDLELVHYCHEIVNKKWVRTKKSVARHLTWDCYYDLEHPYTKLKIKKSYEQTWSHNSYCSYQVYTKNSVSKHFPLRKIVSGYIEEIKRWVKIIYQGKSKRYQEWDWQEQQASISEPEEAKVGLEEQGANWRQLAEEREHIIREQRAWIDELEQGKRWLEEQWANWQRLAEERERIILEQQAWIDELERGKAWLEEQWTNWQRLAEERERIILEQQAGVGEPGRGKAWLEEQPSSRQYLVGVEHDPTNWRLRIYDTLSRWHEPCYRWYTNRGWTWLSPVREKIKQVLLRSI